MAGRQNHVTSGVGTPVTLQTRTTVFPSCTVTSSLDRWSIIVAETDNVTRHIATINQCRRVCIVYHGADQGIYFRGSMWKVESILSSSYLLDIKELQKSFKLGLYFFTIRMSQYKRLE